MHFREVMDKYKKGIASEEEKQFIEQELEKHEIIEAYYADIIDIDFTSSYENEQSEEEYHKAKKNVNKKFKKIIFASVGIMIALFVGVFFIISPFVDSLFYNPTKVTVGETEMDIFFDIDVITELNMSGFYSIMAPDFFDSEHVQNQNEAVMNHIGQLSPVSYVSSYLTFEEDLTMEELHQLQLDYPDIIFVWVGVRTPPSELVHTFLGFQPDFGITISIEDHPNLEKYPALDMNEWLLNPGSLDDGQMYLEPKGYELHFKDLLKYVVDREEAVNTLEYNHKHEYYKQTLDYIETHGVKSYGILAYADAGDLIDFFENESIYHIELDDVMVSRKYIHYN